MPPLGTHHRRQGMMTGRGFLRRHAEQFANPRSSAVRGHHQPRLELTAIGVQHGMGRRQAQTAELGAHLEPRIRVPFERFPERADHLA